MSDGGQVNSLPLAAAYTRVWSLPAGILLTVGCTRSVGDMSTARLSQICSQPTPKPQLDMRRAKPGLPLRCCYTRWRTCSRRSLGTPAMLAALPRLFSARRSSGVAPNSPTWPPTTRSAATDAAPDLPATQICCCTEPHHCGASLLRGSWGCECCRSYADWPSGRWRRSHQETYKCRPWSTSCTEPATSRAPSPLLAPQVGPCFSLSTHSLPSKMHRHAHAQVC